MMLKGLRFWGSILKQKEEIPNVTGTYLDWKECEWLLLSMPYTIQRKPMFLLVEYCETAYPQTGLEQLVVTEEELDKYFYISGERKESGVVDNED